MGEGVRIQFSGVIKRHAGLRPLRIAHLDAGPRDRIALSGLDAIAAEVFINLVTGASLPDEGEVLVAGRNTREIATDTEWLASLDRFGLVTDRAVLLETQPIAANLALPFTLAIDPIAEDVRARIGALAEEVGLSRARLDSPASTMSAEERVRLHLARALAPAPGLLLLEHPTARLAHPAARSLGTTLRAISDARGIGWIAVTEDAGFADAAGGRWLRLNPATGRLAAPGFWTRLRRGSPAR